MIQDHIELGASPDWVCYYGRGNPSNQARESHEIANAILERSDERIAAFRKPLGDQLRQELGPILDKKVAELGIDDPLSSLIASAQIRPRSYFGRPSAFKRRLQRDKSAVEFAWRETAQAGLRWCLADLLQEIRGEDRRVREAGRPAARATAIRSSTADMRRRIKGRVRLSCEQFQEEFALPWMSNDHDLSDSCIDICVDFLAQKVLSPNPIHLYFDGVVQINAIPSANALFGHRLTPLLFLEFESPLALTETSLALRGTCRLVKLQSLHQAHIENSQDATSFVLEDEDDDYVCKINGADQWSSKDAIVFLRLRSIEWDPRTIVIETNRGILLAKAISQDDRPEGWGSGTDDTGARVHSPA